MTPLTYGNTPVPYTASWSAEEASRVDLCPFACVPAICQEVRRGEGRPLFGKPHFQRQREVLLKELCDLCGRSLAQRTKVSLSHARLRTNGADGPAIMQVEPMLHKECAATSLRYCPSLKKDVATGSIEVRQVKRFRVQLAIIAPQSVPVYVPGYEPTASDRIIGHAKVELLDWNHRRADWLDAA